jgi:hypothetical protein
LGLIKQLDLWVKLLDQNQTENQTELIPRELLKSVWGGRQKKQLLSVHFTNVCCCFGWGPLCECTCILFGTIYFFFKKKFPCPSPTAWFFFSTTER